MSTKKVIAGLLLGVAGLGSWFYIAREDIGKPYVTSVAELGMDCLSIVCLTLGIVGIVYVLGGREVSTEIGIKKMIVWFTGVAGFANCLIIFRLVVLGNLHVAPREELGVTGLWIVCLLLGIAGSMYALRDHEQTSAKPADYRK